MSSSRFVIRQGDRAPELRVTPSLGCDEDFDPDDFVGYTLRLYGPVNLSGAMTVDAATGELVFTWPAGSTAIAGTYLAIVQATTVSGGLQRTFPAEGGLEVVIAPLPG